MRKRVVAGNWKMNGSLQMVTEFAKSIRDSNKTLDVIDIIIFPPAIYLPRFSKILSGTSIQWGAQNINEHEKGAYTGEIAANMLHDFGCKFVIVGHSERRQYYGESDALVAKKIKTALDHQLTPILCVGETKEQREQSQTEKVIAQQINVLLDESVAYFKKIIIAYEPVWAIGTGLSASPEAAQQVHQFIRQLIAKKDEQIAAQCSILYGGSVKPETARALFVMKDIDGGLIGGASLEAHSFLDICQHAADAADISMV